MVGLKPLRTNDVLRMELGNGIVRSWEIQGFFYGGLGQEGVIELRAMGVRRPKVSKKPEPYDEVEMFAPSDLIHRAIEMGLLKIFRPSGERDDLEEVIKQSGVFQMGGIIKRKDD